MCAARAEFSLPENRSWIGLLAWCLVKLRIEFGWSIEGGVEGRRLVNCTTKGLIVTRPTIFRAILLDLDLRGVLRDGAIFALLTVVRLAKDLVIFLKLLAIDVGKHSIQSLLALLCPLDLQVVLVGLKFDDYHRNGLFPHLSRHKRLIRLVSVLFFSRLDRV